MNPLESRLTYPFGDDLPPPGKSYPVVPGLLWVRMPLPFALDHINVWLVRDRFEGREGYTLIDCGAGLAATRTLWDRVIEEAMDNLPIVRILCTHTHPDHIGNAAWLATRFKAPIWMTLGEYAMGRVLQADLAGTDGRSIHDHYVRHGLKDPAHLGALKERSGGFRSLVPEITSAFRRIEHGEVISVGPFQFRVITGFGHSPEHASLYSEAGGVLVSGDMLLPRISTNVSVHAIEPEANPVTQYLNSLSRFEPLPDDTLVLPSHGRPFVGIAERVKQLRSHHADRLAEVEALAKQPITAADVVPIMFRRPLDSHQLFFAFGEALAHLHALWYEGKLHRSVDADGVFRFQQTA